MDKARDASCRQCRYWLELQDQDGDPLGMCRRNPPAYEGWPITRPHEWCGEFVAKG